MCDIFDKVLPGSKNHPMNWEIFTTGIGRERIDPYA